MKIGVRVGVRVSVRIGAMSDGIGDKALKKGEGDLL